MSLEEKLYSYANNHQLVLGITSADSFAEQQELIANAHNTLAGFVSAPLAERIHPRLTMADAKSILVVAMPYPRYSLAEPKELFGRISVAALGEDYHRLIDKHLCQLTQLLQQANPLALAMSFADIGPLPERLLAVRAGVGWIGKNGLLHTSNFGSMVFLGYVITNIVLKESLPIKKSCGNCKRCINACPTDALSENGFQMHRCISYLTQKKGLLSLQEMKLMNIQIYGCDQCQLHCPDNQWWFATEPNCTPVRYVQPLLADLLEMDKTQFNTLFQSTAAGWRGRNAIRKNAVIALGNTNDFKALPLLEKALHDNSPLIRETAAMALQLKQMENERI